MGSASILEFGRDDDDEETKRRLDESQKQVLKKSLKSAGEQLDEAIFRAYRVRGKVQQ